MSHDSLLMNLESRKIRLILENLWRRRSSAIDGQAKKRGANEAWKFIRFSTDFPRQNVVIVDVCNGISLHVLAFFSVSTIFKFSFEKSMKFVDEAADEA